MTDRLCLISYRDIEADKTYSNISEYLLRENRSVSGFLSSNGADERILSGEASDYELFSAIVDICREENVSESAVALTINAVIKEIAGEGYGLADGAEVLWRVTSDRLHEKKLRALISERKIERLGIPIMLGERFDSHFAAIKNKSLIPVACPLGVKSASFETINRAGGLENAEKIMSDLVSQAEETALFFNDADFDIPNEYAASKAMEKLCLGQKPTNKEATMLASQLMRMTMLAAAGQGKEIMLFLPPAPQIKSMGAVAELLDYMDGLYCYDKLRVTLFGGDAVSLCMARSIAEKRYKKITAVAGICGNGSIMPDKSSARYWGFSGEAKENYASLAPTPALLATE